MTWSELFIKDRQPTMEDISGYIGTFRPTWDELLRYFETAYKCTPKLTHSGCGMKPGWNIKFQKGSAAFGTWYPQPDAFDVMFTWSYKLDPEMMLLVPSLTPYMAEKVQEAEDFMKNGRWIMFRADDAPVIEDYKRMCAVKRPPAGGNF